MEKLEIKDENLPGFYHGKRVFITGHTGFKGSWLLAVLSKYQAVLKGYALPPEYDEGLFNLLHATLTGGNIYGDIRDKEKLKSEIHSFQPDFIFHLAAQPLVRRSYKVPYETFDTNIMGTINVVEAARELTKKCPVIIITTDKVYLNKETNTYYKEDDPLGGYDPYSSSKAAVEIVVSSYSSSFFKENEKGIATARAGNVIGGGDWNTDRLLPDIIRSLQVSDSIKLRNPTSIRPWQHVLEPLSGYLRLAALMDKDPISFSKPYNFGPLPDDHLEVREVAEIAIKKWGSGKWISIQGKNQPHEAGILKLDITRATKELGWEPRLKAATAVQWTIEWFKMQKSKRLEFTLTQITDYFNL